MRGEHGDRPAGSPTEKTAGRRHRARWIRSARPWKNGRLRMTDMIVETSRFGRLDLDEDRVVTFPKGLLGFSKYTQYTLLQLADDNCFYWLQSVEQPDLAFIVTDPTQFVSTYRVHFKQEHTDALGIDRPQDAEVFVIVNKHANMLTGNLQGPLIISTRTRLGEQLVLSDRRFTTRAPLMELPSPVAAMSA